MKIYCLIILVVNNLLFRIQFHTFHCLRIVLNTFMNIGKNNKFCIFFEKEFTNKIRYDD